MFSQAILFIAFVAYPHRALHKNARQRSNNTNEVTLTLCKSLDKMSLLCMSFPKRRITPCSPPRLPMKGTEGDLA